jgi:hypothetical protein
MLIVRKQHLEFRNKSLALFGSKERRTQTGKRMARSVSRRHSHMAVGTDDRGRPFAGEKLGAMTVQASIVFGEVSYVSKRVVTLSNFLPIL